MTAPRLAADVAAVRRAAGLLRGGEVVAFPTDTVYGLAALADDPRACRRVYEIKRRPADMPLIAMAPDLAGLESLVEVTDAARSLAVRWWPGPLTLVLRSRRDGDPTLGVRVPDHPVALALLREVGRPLMTTSANLSGQPPTLTPEAAARLSGVAAVLDAGPSPGGRASTVLTLATLDPEVLRAGPISRQELLLPLLAEHFLAFSREAGAGGSPLYEAISTGVAEQLPVLRLLLGAQPGQRRANLLLGAVHLLLAEGAGDRLREWYPDLGGTLPAGLAAAEAFGAFALRHADRIEGVVATHRTQTNEVLRSASLVLALAQLAGPVALIDAGCSAGLNLRLDRYRYDFGIGLLGPPDASLVLRSTLRGPGAEVPSGLPRVVWRAGLDAAPLDPADAETARWLLALVWPEHRDRRQRLASALRIAAAAPARLHQGDLLRDLPAVAVGAPRDATLVVQHSAVTTYLAPADRYRFSELCRSLGAHEISLEGPPKGHWTHNLLALDGRLLARADPHNRFIDWLAG
ncbi:MAG: L-threonylcarbamoyladenylate synthase [Candidatus Dormibacteraceae bacterium]